MDPNEKKELKRRSKSIQYFTSIGKNGISDQTIIQINNYLKVHKLCKVKVLRTYLDESGKTKKEVANELAERTGSELIDVLGLTISLWKK
jgi:RNA-binding protein